MSLDLFSAQLGFNIFENASILSGTGAPGGDTAEQDAAELGTLFLRIDAEANNLQAYVKVATNDNADDWEPLATQTYVDEATGDLTATETNVTTITTIDEVLVDDYNAVQWWVTVIDEVGDGDDKLAFAVYALHDGTSSADASEANHTRFQIIKVGDGIDNVTVTVDVDGTGASQTMRLRVTSATAVTVNATRRNVL